MDTSETIKSVITILKVTLLPDISAKSADILVGECIKLLEQLDV